MTSGGSSPAGRLTNAKLWEMHVAACRKEVALEQLRRPIMHPERVRLVAQAMRKEMKRRD